MDREAHVAPWLQTGMEKQLYMSVDLCDLDTFKALLAMASIITITVIMIHLFSSTGVAACAILCTTVFRCTQNLRLNVNDWNPFPLSQPSLSSQQHTCKDSSLHLWRRGSGEREGAPLIRGSVVILYVPLGKTLNTNLLNGPLWFGLDFRLVCLYSSLFTSSPTCACEHDKCCKAPWVVGRPEKKVIEMRFAFTILHDRQTCGIYKTPGKVLTTASVVVLATIDVRRDTLFISKHC